MAYGHVGRQPHAGRATNESDRAKGKARKATDTLSYACVKRVLSSQIVI